MNGMKSGSIEPYLLCNGCEGKVKISQDVISGEIINCPDCGITYELEVNGFNKTVYGSVKSLLENGKTKDALTMTEKYIGLKVAEVEEEDWGE